MAIQIEEKLLSNEAKEFLNNTKNKSRLLREALEFYIRNIKGGTTSTESIIVNADQEFNNEIKDIKNILQKQNVVDDIKDIKKMLQEITIGNKAIVIDETSVDMQDQESIIKNKKIPVQEELKTEVKKGLYQEVAIINEKTKANTNNPDGMTEKQRLEIEKMLDVSLDNF